MGTQAPHRRRARGALPSTLGPALPWDVHHHGVVQPDHVVVRRDDDEAALSKELTLQVRKVIGPFAAPKKIFIVGDLPKTRSGKVSHLPYSNMQFSIPFIIA